MRGKLGNYLVMISIVCVLAACQTTMALKTEYNGALPATVNGGTKVKLALDITDQNGKPYEAESLVAKEYRVLAESGLRKAGYVVSPEADTEVRIILKGRTPNGIVNNASSVGRNLAVGVLTLGMACDEWEHTINASGQVTVARKGQTVADQSLDMKATNTSCFSKFNPSWLANHQEVSVRTYESAVVEHIGGWLPLVGSGA
jgi:hypothetical protein